MCTTEYSIINQQISWFYSQINIKILWYNLKSIRIFAKAHEEETMLKREKAIITEPKRVLRSNN